MKVKELVTLLREMPQNAEVVLEWPGGFDTLGTIEGPTDDYLTEVYLITYEAKFGLRGDYEG